jgi:hypothetical protein
MWLRWFPWKMMVSRLARRQGFIDPVKLLARLEGFAQPLEVRGPTELLRAGVAFHARGLLNTGAIQHNLDWIWPYWVERQYNPHDESFIPRSFSITHINLTQRNWTAIGIPDVSEFPIVDPRGLLTPHWDGWSLDSWLIAEDGRRLLPSRLPEIDQSIDATNGLAVVTRGSRQQLTLRSRAEVIESGDGLFCRLDIEAEAAGSDPIWLVIALRPYNPEGVSFVHEISLEPGRRTWRVERTGRVLFDIPPDRFRFSHYRGGDVHTRLLGSGNESGITCRVGMATAAALFAVDGHRQVQVRIPLETAREGTGTARPQWKEALSGSAVLRHPDRRFAELYDLAVRSLILHSPGEVFPGPYTYKRFWFRDAAFILHALLCIGLDDRVERALDRFPLHQKTNGFFHSQEGEWDSNGEALWIFRRYCELTGRLPKTQWRQPIDRGARWISRKRLPDGTGTRHSGLLPAGFSAEHLGPNDYYYWDDFWGVSGLRSAALLHELYGDEEKAAACGREADDFFGAIERSLAQAAARLGRQGMPASPYRRMDAGAIGSLAAGYPLQLFSSQDPRLLDTVEYLMEHCLFEGGFFQDIIHSGVNPYLTLHMAQVLMRAGDSRALHLGRTVADLASSTGQWPEAVHPRTRGGCMGDGHHVWASAEWVLYVRHCFVREEEDHLVLAAGIDNDWLERGQPLSFGPAPTAFGMVTVTISSPSPGQVEIGWEGNWRAAAPPIKAHLPGLVPAFAAPGATAILLQR